MISRLRAQLHAKALAEIDDRSADELHPSEICKDGWCPRSAFLRLKYPPPRTPPTFTQQLKFENGHSAHHRYQGLLAAQGRFAGYWVCDRCEMRWHQYGLPTCPGCGRHDARYDEQPVEDARRMIGGRTDGVLFEDDALLEIKTVGLGSVRMLAPNLLIPHTYTVDGKQIIDEPRVWDSIRRPFSDHVRQGSLYVHCAHQTPSFQRIRKIVFLYEWKATNDVKEFTVTYNEQSIRKILDAAEQIAAAMRGQGPVPACRKGLVLCSACQELEPSA